MQRASKILLDRFLNFYSLIPGFFLIAQQCIRNQSVAICDVCTKIKSHMHMCRPNSWTRTVACGVCPYMYTTNGGRTIIPTLEAARPNI